MSSFAMAMRFYLLIVGILAVWRLAHLLYGEDGPWNLMAHLRQRSGQGFWGQLLDCFYCLSLWVALPFAAALGDGLYNRVLLWPALSAGAIVLERLTLRGEAEILSLPPRESNDVLRQSSDTDARGDEGESTR
jgi:hypothetical protein